MRAVCAAALACTFGASCGRSTLSPRTDAMVPDAVVVEVPVIVFECLGASVRCGGAAGLCVDTRTDNQNCGACANACPPGSACWDGACAPSCPPPQVLCRPEAGPPYCATSATDPDNCGACERRCDPAYRCSGGACVLSCPADLATCAAGGDGGLGEVCVDTSIDPDHCGGCGRACTLPHASSFCGAGVCGVAACAPGFVDCDGLAANGCECAAAACAAGVCRKRVFVTSQTYGADLGGLDGGDRKCQARADAGGLGGTYRAWLSDETGSPETRFARSSAPYVLVDGTVIANDWTDLTDASLSRPIDKTEMGGPPPLDDSGCGGGIGHPTAWSDTWWTGKFAFTYADCDNWSSTMAFSGFTGLATATNQWWSMWCQMGCDRHAALFCLEQ